MLTVEEVQELTKDLGTVASLCPCYIDKQTYYIFDKNEARFGAVCSKGEDYALNTEEHARRIRAELERRAQVQPDPIRPLLIKKLRKVLTDLERGASLEELTYYTDYDFEGMSKGEALDTFGKDNADEWGIVLPIQRRVIRVEDV